MAKTSIQNLVHFTYQFKIKQILPLLVILTLALVVRINLCTGMIRGDDFVYAHAAYELSEGRLPPVFDSVNGRLAQYAPTAFFYRIFGAGDASTLAMPILCSLMSLVFIHGIARMFSNEAAGLFAASIWAILPLDIFLSTDLLPDAAVCAFSTGAVYFLFSARRSAGWKKAVHTFFCLFFLVWAMFVKPLSAITLFFVVIYLFCILSTNFWNRSLRKFFQNEIIRVVAIITGILLLLFLLYYYISQQNHPYYHFFILQLYDTATDAIELLLNNITTWYLAPLFIISLLYFTITLEKQSYALAGWLAFIFIYFEWGSINTNPLVYDPINRYFDFRNFLFVLSPFVVITGIHLARNIELKKARQITTAFSVLMIVLVILYNNSTVSIVNLLDQISFSSIRLLILLSLLSPFLIDRAAIPVSNIFLSTLFLCMGLSIFLTYHNLMDNYAYLILPRNNLEEAAQYLKDQAELPITVYNRESAVALNYYSEFEFGFDIYGSSLPEHRIKINSLDENIKDEHYILIPGDISVEIPDTWLKLTEFQQTGPNGETYQLDLYLSNAELSNGGGQ